MSFLRQVLEIQCWWYRIRQRGQRTAGGQEKDPAIASVARREQEDTSGGHQKDKRRTQGSQVWHEDSRRTPSRTQGSPARPENGRKMRTTGGQGEDNRRTTPGHRVQGCDQRLWPAFFPKREPQQHTVWGKEATKTTQSKAARKRRQSKTTTMTCI